MSRNWVHECTILNCGWSIWINILPFNWIPWIPRYSWYSNASCLSRTTNSISFHKYSPCRIWIKYSILAFCWCCMAIPIRNSILVWRIIIPYFLFFQFEYNILLFSSTKFTYYEYISYWFSNSRCYFLSSSCCNSEKSCYVCTIPDLSIPSCFRISCTTRTRIPRNFISNSIYWSYCYSIPICCYDAKSSTCWTKCYGIWIYSKSTTRRYFCIPSFCWTILYYSISFTKWIQKSKSFQNYPWYANWNSKYYEFSSAKIWICSILRIHWSISYLHYYFRYSFC
uniref:hypothetical protein n=1 Tax=Malassezia nana TaxID=180528 RepID=UPI0030019254|nr:hypothetical protein [Malassezia nana]